MDRIRRRFCCALLRGTLLAVGLAGLWTLPGCSGCSSFVVYVEPGKDLEGDFSVPLDIYFAPERDVATLKEVGATEWFERAKSALSVDLRRERREQMLRGATVRPGIREEPLRVEDLPEKVTTIFVWAGLPGGRGESGRDHDQLDVKELVTYSLGIFPRGECSCRVEVGSKSVDLRKGDEKR